MYDYLLYFLIFSFLGWCAEVAFHIFKNGRLENRGLAKGPICPIYGIGICLSYFLLGSLESFLLLSFFSMAVATIVEFFVGFLMHKLFGQRLWDYSAEKGNILGYVCPRFSLIWGVVIAAVIRLIPRLETVVSFMKTPFGYAFTLLASALAAMDIGGELIKRYREKS